MSGARVTIPGVQQTSDRQINQISQSVITLATQVASCPLVQGQAITGVTVSSGSTLINHSLGRAWIGWFVTNTNAEQILWVTQGVTYDATKQIPLTGIQSGTVDLWIF